MKTCQFYGKTYYARILIESVRFPPFGIDIAEIRMKTCQFYGKTYYARILIESVRFPPFGFDTVEISPNSNGNMSVLRKDVWCPDSDRQRSVSPLRVRYGGDQLNEVFYVTCNVRDPDYGGGVASYSRVRDAYFRVRDAYSRLRDATPILVPSWSQVSRSCPKLRPACP